MHTCRMIQTVACFLVFTAVLQSTSGKTALLVIDVQDCFLKAGSLAVTGGNDVIPVINEIRREHGEGFDMVVFSQDWHCPDHVSFASQHSKNIAYDVIELKYMDGKLCRTGSIDLGFPHAVTCPEGEGQLVNQTLWPDHCIKNISQGPTSSRFDPTLTRLDSDFVVQKGVRCDVDAYSAFYDNVKSSETVLNSKLQENGITEVFVTGLAADYCVYYTALDAKSLGYKTFVIKDAVRGVANATTVTAFNDMTAKGVTLITSDVLSDYISASDRCQSFYLPLVVLSLYLLIF